MWNARSRFVVILDEKFKEPQTQISEVLSIFWQFRLVNVVVLLKLPARDIPRVGIVPRGVEQLLRLRRSDSAFGVYTWFPYRDRSNCYNSTEVHLLDLWLMEGSGHFALNNFLFPNKIKNGLNNCPVVVSTTQRHPFVERAYYTNTEGSVETVYRTGWDIGLLNILKDAMNMSVRFLAPTANGIGTWLDNGTYLGVIGDLTCNRADIALAGLPLIAPFVDRADHSVVYSRSKFIWLVPCARRLLGWGNVFRMFSYALWLCVFLSLFVAAGFSCLLAKCSACGTTRRSAGYNNLSEALCNIVAVFLGLGVSSVPRTSALRVFFLAWICHCMAVNTVVQSYFTSFIVKSDLERQESSLDDILKSAMEYGFLPQYDKFFAMNAFYENVLRERKDCTREWSCLRRLAYDKDFAMLFSEIRYETDVKYRYLDKLTSRMLVCRIPEPFVSFYYCLYTPKGHHLLERINAVLRRINQAGLYSKVEHLYAHELSVAAQVNDKEVPDDEYCPFSLQHMRIAFCVLLVGQVLAVLTLLLEMLFWNCTQACSSYYRRSLDW
jgi:hypothetical protein